MKATSVGFILVADPPAGSASWRPLADASMWWSRRDSLCRITALSLYLGCSAASPVCSDVMYVFNNSAAADGEGVEAVMAMTRDLVQAVAVPTEFNLLTLWKRAAADAEKRASKQSLLSRQASCVCSFTPWVEATSFAAPSATAPVSASASATVPASLDKRTILRHLQAQCPISFLREWKLNGSEDLILKKVSKSGIDGAWAAWKQQSNAQAASASTSRLQQTFEVLLERAMLPPPARTTLLLLHEDYSVALPVFGRQGRADEDEGEDEDEGGGQHRIICLLGAVRDATDGELSACIAAVKAINTRRAASTALAVACCNLGRTAEFTSKICGTLCLHALAGRLGPAVRAVISASSVSHAASSGGGGGGGGIAVSLAPKLAPSRAGGWTWDGRGNKATTAELDPASAAAENSLAGSQHINFALWVPFTSSAFSALLERSTAAILHDSHSLSPPQAQAQAPSRCDLHALIQAVVCALWRSRVASEHAAEQSATPVATAGFAAVESEPGSVVPSIALVFSDCAILRLSQRAAVRLSAAHQAAPTERQVLLALQQEMASAALVAPRGGEEGVLEALVSAASESAGETNAHVSVIDIRGVASIVPLDEEGAGGGGPGDEALPALGTTVYGMVEPIGSGSESRAVLVLLRPPGLGLDPSLISDSRLRKRVVPLRLLTGCSDPPVSAGLAVTLLLQWAYTRVLVPAVDCAASDFKSRRQARKEAKKERKRARM